MLTPKEIVKELDRYIIGQDEAKKAVAIALRNRYRRSQLSPELMDEITPRNIILKGPTGVGKTEIARRLAKLVNAPFVKVEATKYTEVGYVGKDVESMVRDLVEVAVRIVREEKQKDVMEKAEEAAQLRIQKALFNFRKKKEQDKADEIIMAEILVDLKTGKCDDLKIEIEVEDIPKPVELVPGSGTAIDMNSMFGGMFPQKKKKKRLTVKEALNVIKNEEANKMIDEETIVAEAIKLAENDGVIFLDEIDKIASKGNGNNVDVSREGVQRDILPIVEGSTISTKYGMVKTDYMLFIGAGAFHIASITDLLPELQGRFPIVVDLKSLTKEDFISILKVPENAITYQYATLLKVDKVNLKYTDEAIEKIAEIAVETNETNEDIGARRLYAIMEKLVEEISYNAGDYEEEKDFVIDAEYVYNVLGKEMKVNNLQKYII